jgi:sortase A
VTTTTLDDDAPGSEAGVGPLDGAPAPADGGERDGGSESDRSVDAATPVVRPLSARLVALALGVWAAATLTAAALVLYGIGPLLYRQDQRDLLADLRREIDQAANADESFSVAEEVLTAPDLGDPVAIVDIPELRLQQVVVEGVGPSQTRRGVGHVPGTAGPGQPGNSGLVARRSAFGGSFGTLRRLEPGDRVFVTTTQGRSVYEVGEVRVVDVADGRGTVQSDESSPTSTATTSTLDGSTAAGLPRGDNMTTDDLFGPSDDDRITLVTSGSRLPWGNTRATVAVAGLVERPFEPTPQNGRAVAHDGRRGESGAMAPLGIAAGLYVVTAVAAVAVYRKARARSAYLLTAPPLLAASFLVAESVARTLPAWF